ncbi:MAG: FHA domain-containing protein [Deltaproteobacteria bacterium]|nr:FHA domain-containing protein [Deltaproteobacteria bacterium]
MPSESEQQLLNLDAQQDFSSPLKKTSIWTSMFGWLLRKSKVVDVQDAADSDPVRKILSVPRGIARLDAFQDTLRELHVGTSGHRGVALAFHRELTRLAEQASMDLSLLKTRVELCASALSDAGEAALAGTLLAKIGKKYQAAQLFLEVGAIEELEAAHAAIRDVEGGAKLEARTLYERFEGLFAVGLRKEALSALKDAAKLWPENPLYEEIRNRFFDRLPHTHFQLSFGDDVFDICRSWPITIGRGSEANLSIQSPLVSRIHLRLELSEQGEVVLLSNVESSSDVVVDGDSLEGQRCILEEEGMIDLRGIEIGYQQDENQLELWTSLRPTHRCLAPLQTKVKIDVHGASLQMQTRGDDLFLIPTPLLRVDGAKLEKDLLLLFQDVLVVGETKVLVKK